MVRVERTLHRLEGEPAPVHFTRTLSEFAHAADEHLHGFVLVLDLAHDGGAVERGRLWRRVDAERGLPLSHAGQIALSGDHALLPVLPDDLRMALAGHR